MNENRCNFLLILAIESHTFPLKLLSTGGFSMSMKQAAEQLLKIADEIEKDASEVTSFVCNKCNHTAMLATINAKRKEAAKEHKATTVADITVNDKLHCPACDGVMAYQETEASKPYYYDPSKTADHDETKETPADEKAESPEVEKKEKEKGTEIPQKDKAAAEQPIDYDSLQRYMSASK